MKRGDMWRHMYSMTEANGAMVTFSFDDFILSAWSPSLTGDGRRGTTPKACYYPSQHITIFCGIPAPLAPLFQKQSSDRRKLRGTYRPAHHCHLMTISAAPWAHCGERISPLATRQLCLAAYRSRFIVILRMRAKVLNAQHRSDDNGGSVTGFVARKYREGGSKSLW